MFPLHRLNKGHSLLPLGLLALANCLMIAPSQAQTVDSVPLVQKRDSHDLDNVSGVRVEWKGSELAPLLEESDTRRGINSTAHSSSPLKWTEPLVESEEISVEKMFALNEGMNTLAGEGKRERKEEREISPEPLVVTAKTEPIAVLSDIYHRVGARYYRGHKETVFNPIENRYNGLSLTTNTTTLSSSLAQLPTLPSSQDTPPLTPDVPPKRPIEPLPEQQPSSPPPTPQQVLPSPSPPPPTTAEPPVPGNVPENIIIEGFEFEGNTAISDEELTQELTKKNFLNRPLAFAEVYEVRSIITELYRQRGYVTSGAIIPPQAFRQADRVLKVQIVEGGLESIEVRGTRRLNPEYIRSRLTYAAGTPLNQKALIEALQLLQLDPLIKTISAELTAGTERGSSLLIVQVEEAKTFHLDLSLNNNRSPNIGSFERRLELSQANLFGEGDGIIVGFSNTAGSNTLDASYTYPINPRNGTLNLTTSFTLSNVVESPFDRIDLDADARYFGLTWRQPLQRTLSRELAIGLSLTNQRSEVTVFDVPVRLSPGAEEDGSTTVTALRFFQELTNSSGRHVFGLRSQFNLGLGFLGGTTNEGNEPDSNFLAWRGQVQWVELLARDTLFVLRGDVQVSLNSLLNLEKFGLGGRDTVRGYRQNVLLTDSGASASAEVRFPILRLPRQNALLQLVPFIDMGFVWNSLDNLQNPEPDPNFLASIGLGFRFQMGDRLSARLDWGIPLISTDINSEDKSLQEEGIYFSVFYRIF